jgi:hypothetical protein
VLKWSEQPGYIERIRAAYPAILEYYERKN